MKNVTSQYHGVAVLDNGVGKFPFYGGDYASSMRVFEMLKPWYSMEHINPPLPMTWFMLMIYILSPVLMKAVW